MAPANDRAAKETAAAVLLDYQESAEKYVARSLRDPEGYLPALESLVRAARLAQTRSGDPARREEWELLISRLKVAARRARQKLGLPLR